MKAAVLLDMPGTDLPGLEPRHVRRLRDEAPEIDWLPCRDQAEFLARLPECGAASVWTFRREWLASAPNLRLLSTPSAGREWVEPEPRPGLDVVFGSFHGQLMAETVLALALAFTRGVKEAWERRGEAWPRTAVSAGMRPVRGSRALILGFGHIGKWTGRLLSAAGMRIWGVNRTNLSRPDWFGPGDAAHPLADLDRLLPETDHLVMILPGGAATDGLVDARRLALLPRGAYVYNVGRGNSLDLAALAEALEQGRLAGAGLDVFPREPLPPDDPIRRCRNAVVMPHVSAFAPNYIDLYLDEFVPLARKAAAR